MTSFPQDRYWWLKVSKRSMIIYIWPLWIAALVVLYIWSLFHKFIIQSDRRGTDETGRNWQDQREIILANSDILQFWDTLWDNSWTPLRQVKENFWTTLGQLLDNLVRVCLCPGSGPFKVFIAGHFSGSNIVTIFSQRWIIHVLWWVASCIFLWWTSVS